MEQLAFLADYLFPDGIIYGLTILVFFVGVFKCSRPLLRNASALRRGADLVREGAKAKLSRPVWREAGFLGKALQPTWRGFLANVELTAPKGVACDVAEYLHEESVIAAPGKAALADVIPGLCTSLGILGTFVGLSIGLSDLDLMEVTSYTQLTAGIALAFNTSIVGIVVSLLFNTVNRYATGRARSALSAFTAAFYACAIPQPADTGSQLVAYERDQAAAMSQFASDISGHLAAEIHHAVLAAMTPVQQSLEDFLRAATRAQIDGLDQIVMRFVDRMNATLDGQMQRLGEAIAQTADTQLKAQDDMRHAVDAIAQVTQGVVNVHGVSEEVINKFAGFVGGMEHAYREVGDAQSGAVGLLEEINQASQRQARYLSALQEYQAQLQSSFQDYTLWTDQFIGGLEARTAAQSESLGQVAEEMRASSELLRGSYKSFVESIQVGLANALGLFDENMQHLTRQIQGTLSDIQETMLSLDRSVKKQKGLPGNKQEVG